MTQPRTCKTCGGPILRRSARAVYCSGVCKWTHDNAKAREASAGSDARGQS